MPLSILAVFISQPQMSGTAGLSSDLQEYGTISYGTLFSGYNTTPIGGLLGLLFIYVT
ncbi:hypothetical protein BDB01DRAFT_854862 [Pilobolus umbonatus]|nr:hypothetical protein BDB01DRAFT_854862 [Pilobolus umbonatus]